MNDLVRQFKALANDTRLRLFVEIVEAGERSYSDDHSCLLGPIAARLNVGAPTVSHHLKELVTAGLISTEKQGRHLTCRVNTDALRTLSAFFAR